MEKIKTLLFGAGDGSKQYRINEAKNRTFLAYIDNNPDKHNTKLDNLIIISPLEIKTYNFDEIVITTQWANEVYKQLINELKIDKHKIVLPAKSLLKKPQPFRNNDTMVLARKIIKVFSTRAIENKIPLSLDFGTLLGIIRDDDIIPWDDDIDFALPYSFATNIETWLLETVALVNTSIIWTIDKQIDKDNKIVSYQIKFNNNAKFKNFTTSITFRENQGEYSIHLSSLGQWYAPIKHFDTLDKIKWQDSIVQIPFDVKNYLTFVYGNWEQVNRNMTMTDYNNIGEISFENFNNSCLATNRISN